MTAPRRTGAEQATTRGLIVLFVAVVIGLALLARSPRLIDSAAASQSKPKTTTTTTASTTTSPQGTVVPANTGATGSGTGSVHPPSEIKVLVVNASGKTGVGSKNSTLLTTAHYNVSGIKNGRPLAATTTIYYTDGYQGDVAAVKTVIKVPAALSAILPATPIVPEATSANITVVFGQDYTG